MQLFNTGTVHPILLTKHKTPAKPYGELIDRFLTGFVLGIIAPMWDQYTLDRWSTELVHQSVWQRNPTSFGKKQIPPETAWLAMQLAEKSSSKMHTGDACEVLNIFHGGSGPVASARSGLRWEDTFMEVYFRHTKQVFKRHNKFSMAVDPSTYSGQDTNVGIIYCPDNGALAYCVPVVIRHGDQIDPAASIDDHRKTAFNGK